MGAAGKSEPHDQQNRQHDDRQGEAGDDGDGESRRIACRLQLAGRHSPTAGRAVEDVGIVVGLLRRQPVHYRYQFDEMLGGEQLIQPGRELLVAEPAAGVCRVQTLAELVALMIIYRCLRPAPVLRRS